MNCRECGIFLQTDDKTICEPCLEKQIEQFNEDCQIVAGGILRWLKRNPEDMAAHMFRSYAARSQAYEYHPDTVDGILFTGQLACVAVFQAMDAGVWLNVEDAFHYEAWSCGFEDATANYAGGSS